MPRFGWSQNTIALFTFVVTLDSATTCSASALKVPSAVAPSCTTRPDHLITSDMGAVSVTSVSSPSWDTLVVDLTLAILVFSFFQTKLILSDEVLV
jgi:hypothetical protein